MSSAITRSESMKQQNGVILDGILLKQTNHGVGGSYLWIEKRFRLYLKRIEYGNAHSTKFESDITTIKLMDIYQVTDNESAKNFNEFIITFKNNTQLILKAKDEGINIYQ